MPLAIRLDPTAPCGRSEVIPYFEAIPAILWRKGVGDSKGVRAQTSLLLLLLLLPLLLCVR